MAVKIIYKISEEIEPTQQEAPQQAAPPIAVPEQQLPLPFAQKSKCPAEECPNWIGVQDRRIRDSESGAIYCIDHAKACQSCQQAFYEGNMHEHNEEWYCDRDFNNLFTNCPNCKTDVLKTEIIEPNSANRYSMKQGGCTECSIKCNNCDRVTDKDSSYEEDNDRYCEDCHSELFRMCESCNDTFSQDDMNYIENESIEVCNRCFRREYTTCEKCNDTISKDNSYEGDGDTYCEDCYSENFFSCTKCEESTHVNQSNEGPDGDSYCNYCFKDKFSTCVDCDTSIDKDDAQELEGKYYCEECFAKVGPNLFKPLTENFSQFTYTKKDKLLEQLTKVLPISVKDLKTKYPPLANGLNDLISFAKGKPLTLEVVNEYRKTFGEEFPVEYTVWGGIQRSISSLPSDQRPTDNPQLVMNIKASPELLGKLQANPALYNLFDRINEISRRSTHPYVKDQIGWCRLELDPNGEFILVDEIQCDHSNAGYQLKTSQDKTRVMQAGQRIKQKYDLIGRLDARESNDRVMELLIDPTAQDDKDILTIRDILKRKHQKNDEQLNKAIAASLKIPQVERNLLDKFQGRYSLRAVLKDENIKDDPAVQEARQLLKDIAGITDEQLNKQVESGETLQTMIGLPETKDDIKKVRDSLKEQYQLDDAGLDKLLSDYTAVLADFPNIASQAISRFARSNKFKKIFWHTYETGKKLKNNDPPKSLYEKTPKENSFLPSPNKPFGLEGDFFEKEAKKAQQLYKVARRMYLKYLDKLN